MLFVKKYLIIFYCGAVTTEHKSLCFIKHVKTGLTAPTVLVLVDDVVEMKYVTQQTGNAAEDAEKDTCRRCVKVSPFSQTYESFNFQMK